MWLGERSLFAESTIALERGGVEGGSVFLQLEVDFDQFWGDVQCTVFFRKKSVVREDFGDWF